MTSLPSTLTANKSTKIKFWTNYITIFLRSIVIQRLQICEIPKHEIQSNLSIISQATKITGPNYKHFPILHLSTPAAITVCGSDLLKLYHFL